MSDQAPKGPRLQASQLPVPFYFTPWRKLGVFFVSASSTNLLPRARVAMLAQLYTEGFEHHHYGELLHPVDDETALLLPLATRRRRGFQVVNLTEAEQQDFANSFRATEEMPEVNTTVALLGPTACGQR